MERDPATAKDDSEKCIPETIKCLGRTCLSESENHSSEGTPRHPHSGRDRKQDQRVSTRRFRSRARFSYDWSAGVPALLGRLASRFGAVGLAVLFVWVWTACLRAEGPAEIPTKPHLADMSLEELLDVKMDRVYGASKFEQKITQAPSSISIVTADEIKKFGHQTLADVLRSVRGLYVANDRNYSYLGVRGFLRPGDYNSRVLLLIDGHRMNDKVYDAANFAREHLIDVDLIERVEVIRGPSSSIYGSSAFFGVINVVTKRGRDFQGPEVSVEAGSFNTYQGRFSFGHRFKNDIEWLLSGTRYTSDGQDRLYFREFDQRRSDHRRATNNGVAREIDDEDAFNLFTSLGYHDLTASAFLSSRTKKVPTASYDSLFNDDREETTDSRAYADIKYDGALTGNTRLLARLFYDWSYYRGAYPLDYAAEGDAPDIVVFKDRSVGEWVGTEWQLTTKVFDRHTLLAGVEYRENLQAEQINYDDRPRFYYLKDDRTSRELGLYAQGEFVLFTNLLLNAGVRYDNYFEGFGETVNPRFGLIYSPWEKTTFKALYGQAYRAPNPYERFYNPLQATRPELKPETLRTYELVYEQRLDRHHQLSVSGYHYDVDDLISQAAISTGDIYFDNVSRARATGVEFEMEGKYESGFLVRASYALQRAENAKTGDELSSSPNHLAKLNLTAPVYRDKVFAGIELQYHGRVRALRGGEVDDFVVANFTLLSREIVPGLEASASIYNLFDTRYGYPGAEEHLQQVIEQDGRSFRIKLTYRF